MKKIITRVIVGVLVGAALIFFPQNSQSVSALTPTMEMTPDRTISIDTNNSIWWYYCSGSAVSRPVPGNFADTTFCPDITSAFAGAEMRLNDTVKVGEYAQFSIQFSSSVALLSIDNGFLSNQFYNGVPNTWDVVDSEFLINGIPIRDLTVGDSGATFYPANTQIVATFILTPRQESSTLPVGQATGAQWSIETKYFSQLIYDNSQLFVARFPQAVSVYKPNSIANAGENVNDQNKQDSQNQSQQQSDDVQNSIDTVQNDVDSSGAENLASAIISGATTPGSCKITLPDIGLGGFSGTIHFGEVNFCSGSVPPAIQGAIGGGLAVALFATMFASFGIFYDMWAILMSKKDAGASGKWVK